jgi:hypothetical protein
MKTALLGFAVSLMLAAQTGAKPEDLLVIIGKEQLAVTGYSTGFDYYNCYTDVQREKFEKAKGWAAVVDRLKADARFKAVVAQIVMLEPVSRNALLRRAELSRRPTYAEAVPRGPHADGHSTTDAGAYVESLIARSIVEAVRSMMPPTASTSVAPKGYLSAKP